MESDLLEEDLEEIRADLKKLKEIAQHDHQMLGVLYRYHRWSRAYILLKILIFAGIAFGLYYYVEPLLQPIIGVYQRFGAGSAFDAFTNSANNMPR